MTIRTIFNTFRKLSFSQLLQLFSLLLRHPFFAVMTLVATLKTFQITEKKFPNAHHGDNKGNAFRHALWSCLILMYCCKISSPQKSLKWCKAITDMHEYLFVNEPLQRAMDIHNNKIGMDFFMSLLPTIHRQFFETSFFTDQLYERSQNAQLVTNEEGFETEKLVVLDCKKSPKG